MEIANLRLSAEAGRVLMGIRQGLPCEYRYNKKTRSGRIEAWLGAEPIAGATLFALRAVGLLVVVPGSGDGIQGSGAFTLSYKGVSVADLLIEQAGPDGADIAEEPGEGESEA